MNTSPTPHNSCTQPWAKSEESCRAERNLAMTFVPLPHFLAPVISGLCKHSSGQPKSSMTQQDQSSPKTGTVCSIAQVFACLQSYCSSVDLFQPHRVLQYQSHGFCFKVVYQNKKRNNNNLKTDWHENCSTFYMSSHNRVGTSTVWLKLRHTYQCFSNDGCRSNSYYLSILMLSFGSYVLPR